MIKKITENVDDLFAFYKEYTLKYTDYVLLDKDEFNNKIIKDAILYGYFEKCVLEGFISLQKTPDKTYVTLLYGVEAIQNELLQHIETDASKEIWFHFFNPKTLSWYPLENKTHPGKPGVELNTVLYQLLLKRGYVVNSIQELYYLDLSDFKGKNTLYSSKNLSIDYYNPKIHSGYEAFARNIDAPHWEEVLLNNIHRGKSLPMLVALDNLNVIGFAGPLKVEDSHRGYFAGIGILKEYRGLKLGKYLFNNLCLELKNIGAKYMTLFTGEKNLAKYNYMKARIKVVRQFATMKKIL